MRMPARSVSAVSSAFCVGSNQLISAEPAGAAASVTIDPAEVCAGSSLACTALAAPSAKPASVGTSEACTRLRVIGCIVPPQNPHERSQGEAGASDERVPKAEHQLSR